MAVKHKYSAGELVCQRSKKVKLEFEILWMTIDKMTTCNFMSYHEFKCYICLERFKDFFNLPRIELIKKTILQFLRVCPSFVNTLRAFSQSESTTLEFLIDEHGRLFVSSEKSYLYTLIRDCSFIDFGHMKI